MCCCILRAASGVYGGVFFSLGFLFSFAVAHFGYTISSLVFIYFFPSTGQTSHRIDMEENRRCLYYIGRLLLLILDENNCLHSTVLRRCCYLHMLHVTYFQVTEPHLQSLCSPLLTHFNATESTTSVHAKVHGCMLCPGGIPKH